MATSQLLSLYRKAPSGRKAIVVKNLPDDVRIDDVQNYLEVICKEELADLFFPLDGCNVAVAVFENDVEDVETWQDRVSSRNLGGSVLSVQVLGKPDGICVADMPVGVSVDFLSLYFENKKSGGEEGTVQDVKLLELFSKKHAFVEISSATAIDSILSKDSHRLRNIEVKLEPYYSSVHKCLKNMSSVKQNRTETSSASAIERSIVFERPVQPEVTSQRQQQPKPSSQTSGHITGISGDRETTTLQIKSEPAVQEKLDSANLSQTQQNQGSSLPKRKPPKPTQRQTESQVVDEKAGCVASGGGFRLKIFSDEGEVETLIQDPRPDKPYYSFEEDDMRDKTTEADRHTAVKPPVGNFQRQTSGSSDDSSTDKRKPKRSGNKKGSGEQLTVKEEIALSSVEITMLVMFRFKAKTKNNNLEVILKEKDGKVIIQGSTTEDVEQAKSKLFNCLKTVVTKHENLSPMRCTFLAREQCRNCLRTRCIKQKVWAVLDIDESKRILNAHAFSDDHAEKGLNLVKEEITEMKIRLRPGQDQWLSDPAWKTLIDSLDNGLTTVFTDESAINIVIESFIEAKAKESFRKITQFLKEHVPKKSAEVVLEGAKARCFKVCFEDKVKQDVQQRRGTFEVEEQSRSPLIIKISLEGEESLASSLNKIVAQIWHEKIDFSKISDKAEDKWLMYKGLNCEAGEKFFRVFEKNHNCFIQVSKDGEFRLARPRVQIDEVKEDTQVEEVEDFRRKRLDPETHVLLQAGMSEDEAMQRVLARSFDDSDDEESLSRRGFDLDDAISHGKMYAMEEMMPARRQSEQELYTRPRAPRIREEHVYRSASSPLFGKPLPAQQRSHTITMLNTRVTLLQGEIVKQKADVLVNIVSSSQNMMESVVSKAFVRSAGKQIIEMYDAAKASSNGSDIVVETSSCGRLDCSAVLHVALRKGQAYCQQMINKAMKEVFQICINNGYRSIAFPPLGVGRMYQYPPETVAKQMLAETYTRLQLGHYIINQVTFVAFDDETYNTFENNFKSFNPGSIDRYEPIVRARPTYVQDPFQVDILRNKDQPMVHPLMGGLNNFGIHKTPQAKLAGQARSAVSRRGTRHSSYSSRQSTPDAVTRHRAYSSKDSQDIEKERLKVKRKPHRSRFPDKKPTSSLTVIVIAKDKDTCISARNQLGKQIKDEFLHEERIDKRQNISEYTKKKIVNILDSNDVESTKEKDRYILRGCKEKVTKARMDILELLLQDKGKMEEKKKQKRQVKRETVEYVKYMVDEEPEVPPYWKTYKPDATLKSLLTSFKHALTGKNYEKVDLLQDDPAYSTIVRMVSSTFDQSKIGQGLDARGLDSLGYTRLVVTKVQRIENLDLYERFTSNRQKLFLKLFKYNEVKFPNIEKLPNCTGPIKTSQHVRNSLDKDLHPEINEFLLFHGTKKENVGTICSSGLDPRLGSGKAMFGSGVYGAESATKADQYADDKNSRSAGQGHTKKMFLIRMLLGNCYLCNDQNPHKYRRPPCTTCFMDDCRDTKHERQKFGHMFDSVVGDNGKLFREFVVYEGPLCYPEYLITYERQ